MREVGVRAGEQKGPGGALSGLPAAGGEEGGGRAKVRRDWREAAAEAEEKETRQTKTKLWGQTR